MTQAVRIEVEGEARLRATLAAASRDLENLDKAEEAAGRAIQQRAMRNAPVLTGALAGSIRADTAGEGVTIGSDLRYAVPTEYGAPAINVSAQPFLTPALADATTEVMAAYTAEVSHVLDQVKGA